jgi:asparagine synthase (glutamine-hydrolysing)
MCGIAGVFGPHQPDLARIERTLRLMATRGPDGSGWVRLGSDDRRLTLLHTRLAIVDLDPRANQPFKRDGKVLVFNGEIYNHIELRDQLRALGQDFTTTSDTEVILAAHAQWGEACVERFEGMWAFALFDEESGRLLLSRDRFGEKPLSWWWHQGTLYFASETRLLWSLAGRRAEPDLDQVRRYLVNGYKALNKQVRSFHLGVADIPPACQAVLERPEPPRPLPYWTLSYRPAAMTMDEAREQTRALLDHAIGLRLRADVPVAFCLSGGIDSGVLVSIAAKVHDARPHAFSIVDSDPRYDEMGNIDRVVGDLGCQSHKIHTARGGFIDRLRRQVAYHDKPVVTINYYMHAFMTEAIREAGYKVALSGTGADELFAGYYDHYSMWLAGMSREPDFERLVEDWRASYGAFVRNPQLQDPLAFVRQPDQRGHIYLNQELFESFLVAPVHEPFAEERYCEDLLRNHMLNEIRHETLLVSLREEDHNSMMASVENRAPYLDRDLAEFLYTVPSRHLIHQGFAKWLLRSAGEGRLTDSVRFDRQKRGFNASIKSLVDRNDPATRDYLLADSPIFDLVRRDAMEDFLAGDLTDNSFSKFLFSFISARVFLEHAQEPGPS